MAKGIQISRRSAVKAFAFGLGSLSLPQGAFSSAYAGTELLEDQASIGNCLRLQPKVDQYVEAMRKRAHIPSIAVGVLKDGELVLAKGYGRANLEHDIAATEKTLYPIASLTKCFLATAIMILVEDNCIRLDDKIVDYLPELPKQWSAITIKDCLGHSSGIKNFVPDTIDIQNTEITKDGLYKLITNDYKELLFPPGEEYHYSSSAYYLLALIYR